MQLTVKEYEETTPIIRQVQYVAPDKQLVDTVAKKVSQIIGVNEAIDQKERWDFYKGLSGFMNIFVTLYAKQLNRNERDEL